MEKIKNNAKHKVGQDDDGDGNENIETDLRQRAGMERLELRSHHHTGNDEIDIVDKK